MPIKNSYVLLPVDRPEGSESMWVNPNQVVRIIPHMFKCTITFTNGRAVTVDMRAADVVAALGP